MAYLGRYGHFGLEETLQLTVGDMRRLSLAVNALVTEEAESVQRGME